MTTPDRSPRSILVAGVASGVGKTTVSAGLAGALRSRGWRVQPFKAGPDYIDPSHLTEAAGNPCRNLDTWLLPEGTVLELFQRAAAQADIALIEGVMGLFDGAVGGGGAGSAAHLARLLGAPVMLVVDASAMGQSTAAVVQGFQHFDRDLRFMGVVLNRVAGASHAAICADAIEGATGLPVLGWLPQDPAIAVPERHLGLVPNAEESSRARLHAAADAVASHLDLDTIRRAAAPVPPAGAPTAFPPQPLPPVARIAVARDEAFNFYYQDGLDLLTAWGAELVPFSPLADSSLPAGTDAVYLGGGFPELFAAHLAANAPMRRALQMAVQRGVPVYAECGGLMYLGRTLEDLEGRGHTMMGILPADCEVTGDRVTIGYREIESRGTPLLPAGERVRGHEFHLSRLRVPPREREAAYRVLGEPARAEGFRNGSAVGSYIHTHFASRPDLAANFVASARGKSSGG